MRADLPGEVLPPVLGTNVAVHSREFCPAKAACPHHRRGHNLTPRFVDCRRCDAPRLENLQGYAKGFGNHQPLCRPCFETRSLHGPALWLNRQARNAHLGVPG